MRKLIHTSLLCYICLIVFVFLDLGDTNTQTVANQRPRRYLRFRNVTNLFVRLNFKANMVWWNQIFAQAIGYRLNYLDPPDSFHPHHLYRRDVYNNLELLLDKNGLNGYHCVRRAICEMAMIDKPKDVYRKIFKMIFRQSSDASEWYNVPTRECAISLNQCPFSVLDISLHTDIG